MENKISGSNHFFKIMTPENISKLPLPRAFSRKLEGEHSKVAIITSCKGEWEVNVEKSSSGLVYFAEGWEIFAHEHELSSGHLIVFEHIGSMHFTGTVYDLTACEKDFSVNAVNKTRRVHDRVNGVEKKHKKEEEKRRKTNASVHNGRPHFTSMMKSHSITHHFPCKVISEVANDEFDVCTFCIKQYIPIAFWKAHGIDKKKTIILRDSTGDERSVNVQVTTSERVAMARGWSDFCTSHNLEIGDVCTFSLRELSDKCDDSVTMDVSISRWREEDFF